MFTKSIRWRLQLWLAFLLVCILSGFGATAYQLQRINRLKQIDDELERRVMAIASDLRTRPSLSLVPDRPSARGPGSGPSTGRRGGSAPAGPRVSPEPRPEPRDFQPSSRTLSLFGEMETNSFYYAVWSRGGGLLQRSSNAPADLSRPSRGRSGGGLYTRMRDDWREVFQFNGMSECVLVGRNLTRDLGAMRRFAGWLVAAGGAVLALGLGGGWLLASRAIRPVEVIGAAASRISAGNLSERINVADTDSELGRLAGVLNSTFARLEAAFAQQKQFTADASHELRTPLAVIISEAQTALARERDAADYRETVEVCLAAAQQMRRLSQSLLELARFDAGQEPIERAPFDLDQRTRDCVDLIRPLARQRGLQIHCDLAPVQVEGDADRICQVVVNLLTNAVHFNNDNGEIRVTTRLENGAAILTVADTGQGIRAEDQPRVFERFYRADKRRAIATGRSGLGLAICQSIVNAHGGTIALTSRRGAGTTFIVRLPG